MTASGPQETPALADDASNSGAQKSAFNPDRLRKQLSGRIGWLTDQASKARCTAFCVGKSRIATAGHCFLDQNADVKPKTQQVSFRVADTWPHRPTSVPAIVVKRGALPDFHPPIAAAGDWALLELAKPVCKGHGITLVQRTSLLPRGGQDTLFLVSIAAGIDRPAKVTLTACRIIQPDKKTERDFSDEDRLLFHDCPVGAGASGAPLLTRAENGDLQVVGMQVGVYARSLIRETKSGNVQRTRKHPVAHIAIRATEIGK